MADRFRRDLDWEDIRHFVALARHGSLASSARALSTSHGTVGRRIRDLEAALGDKLFERRPHGYELTESGRRVLDIAEEMESVATTLATMPRETASFVRITATPTLAETFLIPHLRRFQRAHRSIVVELNTDLQSLSIARGAADIALRLGRPKDSDLLARKVAEIGFGFYASPRWTSALVEQEGAPAIAFNEANSHLPEARWLSEYFSRMRVVFRVNTQIAQAIAARHGVGIALLPHFLGASAPDLHRIPTHVGPPNRELWMLTRPKSRKIKALETMIGYLVELFRKERCFLKSGLRNFVQD
jgi:DNA-binding transcriptional LysR family regulator